jgi:hypothetical protein
MDNQIFDQSFELSDRLTDYQQSLNNTNGRKDSTIAAAIFLSLHR